MILSRVSKDRLAVLREEKLVKKVSRFLLKHDGRRVAYVGGWEHLIEDPCKRTLYSMLGGPAHGDRIPQMSPFAAFLSV
jgi:hypothetical protein